MIGTLGDSQEHRRYKEIQALTPRQVDDIVLTGDPDELRYVAISVSMFSTDFDWAQATCALLARHDNAIVRGNSVLSFGHLARRFGRLDMELVEPIYRDALRDPDEYVRSQAEDMLGDIRYYLSLGSGWPECNVPPPVDNPRAGPADLDNPTDGEENAP